MESNKKIEEEIVERKLEEFKKAYYKNRHNQTLTDIKKYNPEIIKEAMGIIRKFYTEKNASLTPRSVFAASMYISCINNNNPIVQTRMARFFDTNVVSMRRAAKEIIGTEEFRKIIKNNYKGKNWMSYSNSKLRERRLKARTSRKKNLLQSEKRMIDKMEMEKKRKWNGRTRKKTKKKN